jgi:hypothetical protein
MKKLLLLLPVARAPQEVTMFAQEPEVTLSAEMWRRERVWVAERLAQG